MTRHSAAAWHPTLHSAAVGQRDCAVGGCHCAAPIPERRLPSPFLYDRVFGAPCFHHPWSSPRSAAGECPACLSGTSLPVHLHTACMAGGDARVYAGHPSMYDFHTVRLRHSIAPVHHTSTQTDINPLTQGTRICRVCHRWEVLVGPSCGLNKHAATPSGFGTSPPPSGSGGDPRPIPSSDFRCEWCVAPISLPALPKARQVNGSPNGRVGVVISHRLTSAAIAG